MRSHAAGTIVYVAASASGTGDGSSWANAYPSLADALAGAPSDTEIWVANGTYKPTSGTDRTATFGFASKYQKGATVPTGTTEFRFQAGNLTFQSTSYQWLVVNQNGTNAQFKGTGTINGSGSYTFLIWVTDGNLDTFRIQITGSNGNTIYDNGTPQAIGGGSIVIHN